jgi:WD40 repeat protein
MSNHHIAYYALKGKAVFKQARNTISVLLVLLVLVGCGTAQPTTAPSAGETEPLSTQTPARLADSDDQSGIPISPDTVKQVKLVRTLNGHKDRVMALAFSSDNVSIASYGGDKSIKLWDVRSGQEIFSLGNQYQDLNSIAFSPDGRLLASAETIWDVESKQVLHTLDRGEGGKPSFAPDGNLLAVGGMGRPLKLWDVGSGHVVRTFENQANNDTFTTLFSPDGTLLATSGYDGVIELWNVQSGKVERSLSYGAEVGIHSVAFSPDGSLLASGGTDRWMLLWDVASGEVVRKLVQGDGLYGLTFSPDGRLVASAGCDRTVKLWNVESGQLLRTLPQSDEVVAVAFSPDGTLLVSGGYDNQIYVWGIPR